MAPMANVERQVPVAGDDAVKGGKDTALVTIVQFCDFQCPFCKKVLPTLGQLEKRFGQDIRIVYKHHPLPNHPAAFPAARGAICAQQQGKFWPYHDLVYANARTLSDDKLVELAAKVGLDADQFKKCFADPGTQARLDQDIALAKRVGARGTPNFFINGQKVAGALPPKTFFGIVDNKKKLAEKLVAAHGRGQELYEAIMKSIQPGKKAPPSKPKGH